MSFIITRLPDEPIIVAGFDLPLTQHFSDLEAFNEQCVRIADETGGSLYRILHLVAPQIEHADLLLLLSHLRQNFPGGITDPRMYTVAVGTHPLIAVGTRRIGEEFGIDIPIFTTLGEALAYVRTAI